MEVFLPVLLLEDVVTLKTQLMQLIFYIDTSQTRIQQPFMPVYLHDEKILQVLNLYERHPSRDSIEAFAEALKQHNVNECSSAQVTWMKLYRSSKLTILKSVVVPLLHFDYLTAGLLRLRVIVLLIMVYMVIQ